MNLPAGLLHAVSDAAGGRLAVVVGAGCSVEAPTSIPLAGDMSAEAHRQLVLDGVIDEGECADPRNLALLASVVFQKTGSQSPVVERLPLRELRMARANEGYLTLVALMAEGAISYALSLNFDLAVENASSELSTPIEVVYGLNQLVPAVPSIIHLHGSVMGPPAELVLRQETIDADWRGAWQQVVANQILAAPSVLFAGLGSAAPVLTETITFISDAIGQARTIYQADVCEHGNSHFAAQLAVPAERYIREGWSKLMRRLAERVATEQVHSLMTTGQRVLNDNLASQADKDAFSNLVETYQGLPLLALGRHRAVAKLVGRSIYVPRSEDLEEHLVEPLTKLGTKCAAADIDARPMPAGVWCLERDGKRVATALLATGKGSRRLVALEPRIEEIARDLREAGLLELDLVLVGGTQPEPALADLQTDIIADEPSGDLISGPRKALIIVANDPLADLQLESVLDAA